MPLFKLIVSVLIFVTFYFLSFVAIALIRRIEHITSKTKTSLDNILMESLKLPIRGLFVLGGGYAAVYYLNPELAFFGFSFVKIFTILFILFGAYAVVRVIGAVFSWYVLELRHKTRTRIDDTLFRFLKRIVNITVYAIALLIIMDKLGLEIGPALAGLGIAGLAAALALQDTLSNFFSSVYIAADRPIKIGDYIELASGEKGYVEDIGWRNTKIRTLPNNIILVPNAKLTQTILTNYNAPQKEMSIVIQVSVSYDSDLEKVERVTIAAARKVLKTVDGGVPDFEPFTRYHTFGDSGINFSVILRVKSFVDQYLITHEFVKELKRSYDKEKIVIPFPQRDVHIKKR